mgnify:CR=1 FL=1
MRLPLLLLFLLTQAPAAPKPEPYSQVEQLRIENLKLERVIVDRAVLDWRAKALKLKADLEAPRKGFRWNPDDDSWTPDPVKDTK